MFPFGIVFMGTLHLLAQSVRIDFGTVRRMMLCFCDLKHGQTSSLPGGGLTVPDKLLVAADLLIQ
jgi:hypothetical protein